MRQCAQRCPDSDGRPGQAFLLTLLAPEEQGTLSSTHSLLFLISGHSGSKDCGSPCLQTPCLEIYTLPQTSHIFATHTSRFSNKCSLTEFPGIYIG